jgi:hypothetical protein
MLESQSGPFGEPTGDLSGIDADALLSQVESHSSASSREMDSPKTLELTTPHTPQATPEIEFTWNGKQIKAPITDPRISQWASQGYDYAHRMAEFNQRQEALKTESERIKQYDARYRPVEEYIEKNPEWWKHVNEQWQQLQSQKKDLGVDPNNPLAQKLTEYDQKLSQVEQFIQAKQQEELKQKQTLEDQALEQEIQSIRKEYADQDWSKPDLEGKTLEFRVLEHAKTIGTTKFRAAFRDLKFEELQKIASERAKEDAVKERQKQTKLGLLGKTPAPKEGLTQAQDYRNKSYDQLLKEGMREMGIA